MTKIDKVLALVMALLCAFWIVAVFKTDTAASGVFLATAAVMLSLHLKKSRVTKDGERR